MGTGQTYAPDAAAIEETRLAEAAIARLPVPSAAISPMSSPGRRFRRRRSARSLGIEDRSSFPASAAARSTSRTAGLRRLPPMIHLYRALLDEWVETASASKN
jgi:hypothetical protein